MTEKRMRQRIVKILDEYDPISVENPAHPGTPDLNCTLGWIELKQEPVWPVRASTPLRVPHFTMQQRVWLKRRHRSGGNAWLLLQVGQEWLLFSGNVAAEHLGNVTREALYLLCIRHWRKGLVDLELIECLRNSYRPYPRSITSVAVETSEL